MSVFVLLSFAQSLNGKIAAAPGTQSRISGQVSLLLTHALRGRLDAILVGIGTVLSDDPRLSCRYHELVGSRSDAPPLGQPRPIVLDPDLRTPPEAALFSTKGEGPLVFCHQASLEGSAGQARGNRLKVAGAELVAVQERPFSWKHILSELEFRGIRSIFVEGGAGVISSVLESGAAHELILTTSPQILPETGPGWSDGGSSLAVFEPAGSVQAGRDMVSAFRPRGSASAAPYGDLSAFARQYLPVDQPVEAKKDEEAVETFRCRQALFTAPGTVEVRSVSLSKKPGEVLVESKLIGISAGTEMVVYRGSSVNQMDEALPQLRRDGFPFAYGYMNVGLAADGRRVFGFAPHQDRFASDPADLIDIGDLAWEDAVFLPSMETALGIAHDLHLRTGEVCAVAGLGVIGLLVTEILVSQGVRVIGLEPGAFRRAAGTSAGARCLDPSSPGFVQEVSNLTEGRGWDSSVNLSGSEQALQCLIDAGPSETRIIEASWYGDRPVDLRLGGKFHRNRLSIRASQVSRIDATLQGRWDKRRRFSVVLDLLARIRPSKYITHRLGLGDFSKACGILSAPEHDCLQLVLDPTE